MPLRQTGPVSWDYAERFDIDTREVGGLGTVAGLSKQHRRAYQAWYHARRRCSDEFHKQWTYYGGRGIAMCQLWLDSFEVFLADMGDPPPGMSLDRIDNDGNYEPGNCRWADASTQQRNRRKS